MGARTLSNVEAAEYLGIQPQTLAVWRSERRHDIPYVKVGQLVRYRIEDLDAWLESRVIRPEPAAG